MTEAMTTCSGSSSSYSSSPYSSSPFGVATVSSDAVAALLTNLSAAASGRRDRRESRCARGAEEAGGGGGGGSRPCDIVGVRGCCRRDDDDAPPAAEAMSPSAPSSLVLWMPTAPVAEVWTDPLTPPILRLAILRGSGGGGGGGGDRYGTVDASSRSTTIRVGFRVRLMQGRSSSSSRVTIDNNNNNNAEGASSRRAGGGGASKSTASASTTTGLGGGAIAAKRKPTQVGRVESTRRGDPRGRGQGAPLAKVGIVGLPCRADDEYRDESSRSGERRVERRRRRMERRFPEYDELQYSGAVVETKPRRTRRGGESSTMSYGGSKTLYLPIPSAALLRAPIVPLVVEVVGGAADATTGSIGVHLRRTADSDR
eukprot:GHVU01028875.1.p1 GENE.GHVU01028875.1~~GHVU01028875.1.p1  ORF type:complete len:399 (+),score=55.25 GHVU01028875.1:89-1198(+)